MPKRARTDLCGGWPAMVVPTVTTSPVPKRTRKRAAASSGSRVSADGRGHGPIASRSCPLVGVLVCLRHRKRGTRRLLFERTQPQAVGILVEPEQLAPACLINGHREALRCTAGNLNLRGVHGVAAGARRLNGCTAEGDVAIRAGSCAEGAKGIGPGS
jgi:hypothetical protein